MADFTAETVTRRIHRWIVPAAEPRGAAAAEIGKAWAVAERAYREHHGLDHEQPLHDDALRFHVRDEAVVIEFQTDHPVTTQQPEPGRSRLGPGPNLPPHQPRKAQPMTTRLARAITVHLAWREDDNAWDGFALYLDEDTAKAAAADDWESYEHGGFDEDDERARPLLTWESAYDRWVLLEDGRDTGVRVNAMPVHRPASTREIEAMDALTAAKDAARRQRTA